MADQAKTRKKRASKGLPADERRLLELMTLGEGLPKDRVYRCQLTSAEIAEMDAYVAREAAKIRAGWTAEREAEARGVDVRASAKPKTFLHDGRLFPCSTGADAIPERLFELPHRSQPD